MLIRLWLSPQKLNRAPLIVINLSLSATKKSVIALSYLAPFMVIVVREEIATIAASDAMFDRFG